MNKDGGEVTQCIVFLVKWVEGADTRNISSVAVICSAAVVAVEVSIVKLVTVVELAVGISR